MSFVHLHTHSEYSLLDGAIRVRELGPQAAAFGMPAIALTDHGVLYGAVEFARGCEAAGVKPIIGCEVYLADGSRFGRQPQVDDRYSHLVLLAQDERGYRNLVRLVTAGWLEGFYYKPRIDWELLAAHHEGLICTSACLGGPVARLLRQQRPDDALGVAKRLKSIFGKDRFYIEVQNHGLPDEIPVNEGLVGIAAELGLGLVGSNDAHYLRREDAAAHDVLLCIQTGKVRGDEKRMRFPNDQFYLKSPAEMAEALAAWPEAIANTLRIAEQCSFAFPAWQARLPAFPLPPDAPAGLGSAGYLRAQAERGLRARYPDGHPRRAEAQARLEHELHVITTMGFADYFLIVADFIAFARSQGIPVGPGRGSGAGSLVAYALGITAVDPLEYGLLFERFLNPERIDLPDFDIDFCYERRGEVVEYVTRKYGADRVAHIITFGTLAARAAVRDVGRVLDMPYGEVDRLAKLVPAGPGVTLEQALAASAELRQAAATEPAAGLLAVARQLEGLPRHASTHAAGIVIAPEPLTELVPLATTGDGQHVTQYAMDALAGLGLLKMDFLGLRTLTVLHRAAELVQNNYGVAVDLAAIPLDDEATLQLLARGDTLGVFQLEAGWVRDFLRQLQVSRFEDIVATVALCRPGPMENIPLYLQAKAGAASYPHPDLEPVLRDTYGVMIYQEQIMQVAAVMAGFSLGEADLLRRAVAKKQPQELARYREAFVAGCLRQGHSERLAHELYDLIQKFAGYGFNKSHSVAYGYVAYQCAWMKAHYPAEFWAAQISSVLSNTAKVALYLDECRRSGLKVVPPDVNVSEASFTARDGAVVCGLAAIRGVGPTAMAALVKARQAGGPFQSLRDLCERVDSRHLTKRVLEALIKAGACDRLPAPPGQDRVRRSQLLATYEQAWEAAQSVHRYRQHGQATLFDLSGAEPAESLPELPELRRERLLAQEKEMLGFYVSGHPLETYRALIDRHQTANVAELTELPDGSKVTVAGLCAGTKLVTTRQGQTMAFVAVEDMTGTVETVVFPRLYEQVRELLTDAEPLLLHGRIAHEDEGARLLADEVTRLAEAAAPRGQTLYVRVTDGDTDSPVARRLLHVLRRQPRGPVPVVIHFQQPDRWIRTHREMWVDPSPAVLAELAALLGEAHVRLAAAPGSAVERSTNA